MSESGILRVSIPRLSMHTGPGTGVKPVYGIKNKRQRIIETLSYLRLL